MRRTRGRRGQSLIEFALVAPLFLLMLIGVFDGGLLLFSMNSVDNATSVASNALAALGNRSDADATALKKMAAQGFADTGLIAVGEVDISKLVPDATKGYQRNADGSPKIDTSCGGGACTNRYKVTDPGGVPTVVTWTGACDPTVPPCSVPWPPAGRNVTNGSCDYVEITVNYQYHFFALSLNISQQSVKTLRLEPQV